MPDGLTAGEVVARIRAHTGAPWKESGADAFQAGAPETAVIGIATAYAATIDVLCRAAAAKRNMIVCREPPFWDRGRSSPAYSGSGDPPRPEQVAADPTYRYKQTFIRENGLVVWRFSENWDARAVDGQLRGLARALGWDRYHQSRGAPAYGPGDHIFRLPTASLEQVVRNMESSLNMKGVRVIGDPRTKVAKVALTHGFILVPQLTEALKEPSLDAVVVGEPVEWEAAPYFLDVVASGHNQGMIILGQEVSEEPGSGEVASWLKTIVPEVPVEWISAREPFWTLT